MDYTELVKELRESPANKRLMTYAADAIEQLTADVRPVVRGKWERTSRSLYACSQCGNCIIDERVPDCFFCPNCGADMPQPPKEETE